MAWRAALLAECRALLATLGPDEPGYIPPLVRFTHEDKAAKGLRKFEDPNAPKQPPVHFTALEVVQQDRLVLLTGEAGSGKTTFARHLARHLAGEIIGSAAYNSAALARDVPRNDAGTVAPEAWTIDVPAPLLREAASLATDSLPTGSPLLLIVDAVETRGPDLLVELAALAATIPTLRLLVLGDAATCRSWPIPTAFRRHLLRPLLAAQRGGAATPAHAGFHAAARALGVTGDETAIAEAWRVAAANGTPPRFMRPQLTARDLENAPTEDALAAFAREPLAEADTMRVLARRLRQTGRSPDALLRGLARLDGDAGLHGAVLAAGILGEAGRSHLTRSPPNRSPLTREPAPRSGARGSDASSEVAAPSPPRPTLPLAAARPVPLFEGDGWTSELPHETHDSIARLAETIAPVLLRIVDEGLLAPASREEAGRALARWGDPRDLLALCPVSGGAFTMGSALHPNSAPAHRVRVAPFRISRFPVTNGVYRRFVDATARAWRSVDGMSPDRASAPAVDLTWRDADAFCAWLTERWRADGRIDRDERVRLPTEPEWERAARGDQPESATQPIHPWAGAWDADRCNGEEAGLEDTCTVGLFPRGRSPYGADDMAGQVWEWCSTLWGEDMAAPSYRYPYRDDGREDRAAGPRVRRVLRGGCFSSGREKANCTYRGSLEPDGFWRGNGFRFVVARDAT